VAVFAGISRGKLWRKQHRIADVRRLFAKFRAEMSPKAAIEAAGKHMCTDRAWRFSNEWRDEYSILYVFALNHLYNTPGLHAKLKTWRHEREQLVDRYVVVAPSDEPRV
jgi:hypothetical protein